MSEDFSSALYRETEGNPFFVEEVVKSLVEQGQIYRQDGRWGHKELHELAIPQSVKEAVGRRLDRLSEEAVDILRTAAALGKMFAFHELAAVCAANEDALLDALDEASAAQLVRAGGSTADGASGNGERFAFTHDKIREVLYEELNPIRRRRLHQRIGETLETLYPPPAPADATAAGADEHAQDLAYHFAQAGDLEKSLTYARRAARSAERVFAHDEALKFLEQARESAVALKRADELAAVDEEIGDIHEARGMMRLAVESYERALCGATTREARAAVKAKVGNAYVPVGDPRGFARLEEALAELDPRTQTNALALATALVGRYHHYRTEHRKAIEFLERARDLAEPLDDPDTLCNIYGYLAGAHQHLLLYRESDRWARANVALGERRNFPPAIAAGNEFLAENAGGRGQWDAALAFAAQDEEQGRRIGSLARVAWSGFCRAHALHGMGDLVAARAAALAALDLCEQIGEERLASWLDPVLATVHADLADDDAARGVAERGVARARRLDQLLLTAWALHALGYAAMRRGDVHAALEYYGQYVTLVRDTENALARNLILGHAAEAFLCGERLDDATQLARQAVAVAEFAEAPHYLALARRVQGQILAAEGAHDDALGRFDEAIAAFTRIGSRLELARALYHRAALRAKRGEREAARADAAQAREGFAEAGAVRDRALAERIPET